MRLGQAFGAPLRVVAHASAPIAWALSAVAVALMAAALISAGLHRENLLAHLFALGALSSALVGGLVASRRPGNAIGWLLLLSASSSAVENAAIQYIAYGPPEARVLVSLPRILIVPSLLPLLVLLPLLFPTGRLLSRAWRPVVWLVLAWALWTMCYWVLRPGSTAQLPNIPNPLGWAALERYVGILDAVGTWGVIGCMLIAAAGLVVRFRRSAGEERLQLKWLTFAITGWVAVAILSMILGSNYPQPIWAIEIALALLFAGVPLAVGIAVLRYRLYDIDLLINRTLVYGALTISTVAIYSLVVGYLGALFNARGDVAVSLIATGAVAVAFAPLRDRLQRGVNRLLYGERDDPYTALTRLGGRLEATLAYDAVLDTIVETVAETMKLPYAAIKLNPDDGAGIVAEWGSRPAAAHTLVALPLSYHGASIGQLLLAPRAGNAEFGAADWRLLHDFARQAGAPVHAVRLTHALHQNVAELKRSRERLVTTQEEERRRIQRDLHDGLGPVLASMRMRLEAVLDQAQECQPQLIADLERLDALVGQATTDIRRLVHDLRPPALDQLGLVPAMQQYVGRFSRETGIAVQLRASLPGALPAALEVTIYRIMHEALNNVHKHARAGHVTIELSPLGTALVLHISDDGVGGAAPNGGTGIHSMRERAELMGGTLTLHSLPEHGTTLEVFLPMRSESYGNPS